MANTTTSYITLSSLLDQFKGLVSNSNFSSPQLFIQNIIFGVNYKIISDFSLFDSDHTNPTTIPTTEIISGLATRNFANKQFTTPKYSYIVTELIVLHYQHCFEQIESNITAVMNSLDDTAISALIKKLTTLKEHGQLPLIKSEYKITKQNLVKAIVAYFIHCCYCEESCAKAATKQYTYYNICILNKNSVEQQEFEKDFPDNVCPFNWESLVNLSPGEKEKILLDRSDNSSSTIRLNFQGAKEKLHDWDINYHVKTLLKLFLNSDSTTHEIGDSTIGDIACAPTKEKTSPVKETIKHSKSSHYAHTPEEAEATKNENEDFIEFWNSLSDKTRFDFIENNPEMIHFLLGTIEDSTVHKYMNTLEKRERLGFIQKNQKLILFLLGTIKDWEVVMRKYMNTLEKEEQLNFIQKIELLTRLLSLNTRDKNKKNDNEKQR